MADTDTSVLRLRRPPPNGAVYAQWSTEAPELGQPVVGIHNPSSSVQQISVGSVAGFWSCSGVDYCVENGDDDSETYLGAVWEDGVTASGSSGSGLFLPTGELIGVLTAGHDTCGKPDGTADYGRFDVTYRSRLRQLLKAQQTND